MAMINCPECEKQISNQAKNCPHCGCPTPSKLLKKSSSFTFHKAINITCIVFGFIFMSAVLQSTEGPSGNANAAALAWFLTVSGILSLIARKKIGKILLIIASIFYFIAFLIAYASIDIAAAYLLLQLLTAIALAANLHFMKKN